MQTALNRSGTIRVLCADDHPIVREGLKRLIAEHADMSVVGEAVDGDDALTKCGASDVDVLLLDISMPGLGFLEIIRRLAREQPALRVLVLSVHSEDQFAVRALRAGAAGYLTKDQSPEALGVAIQRVHSGGRYISSSLAEKLAYDLGPGAEKTLHETLSDREFQVLCLLGSGESVKEIASRLVLSPKTVSTYRTRIFQKMQFESNAELIRYVLDQGLAD